MWLHSDRDCGCDFSSMCGCDSFMVSVAYSSSRNNSTNNNDNNNSSNNGNNS